MTNSHRSGLAYETLLITLAAFFTVTSKVQISGSPFNYVIVGPYSERVTCEKWALSSVIGEEGEASLCKDIDAQVNLRAWGYLYYPRSGIIHTVSGNVSGSGGVWRMMYPSSRQCRDALHTAVRHGYPVSPIFSDSAGEFSEDCIFMGKTMR